MRYREHTICLPSVTQKFRDIAGAAAGDSAAHALPTPAQPPPLSLPPPPTLLSPLMPLSPPPPPLGDAAAAAAVAAAEAAAAGVLPEARGQGGAAERAMADTIRVIVRRKTYGGRVYVSYCMGYTEERIIVTCQMDKGQEGRGERGEETDTLEPR